MVPKKKIAVLFPAFLKGGAESVALWILESLKPEYDLTLITFSAIDVNQLNELYGTNLKVQDFVLDIPYKKTPIPPILINRYSLFTIRQHLLLRYYKKINHRFDLAIGAFNEMDMGRPGIQYLNSPMFGKGHEKGRSYLGYPDSYLRRIYHRIFETISGFSSERMKENLSLGNSEWTAQLFRDLYQMDVGVLYPPIALKVIDVPWVDRENGFICISRIVPEKKIERAIVILEHVHNLGFDIHLHLVSSNFETQYRNKILKIQAEHASWVHLHEDLSRDQLANLLVHHRYGIHVRENEQFGISVAEMVQAGCIPFVPSQGGQIEIVGNNPILQFGNEDEAVNKIVKVLKNPGLQQDLISKLSKDKNRFGAEIFCRNIRAHVEKILVEN